MIGQRSLRFLGLIGLGVVLLAMLLPRAVAEEDTTAVCAAVLAQAPDQVGYWEGLSKGAKVIGAPIHLIDAQIDRCHLGRWNEPEIGMRRMAAFVFNNSARRSFNRAHLTIWASKAAARATSEYPVEILPMRTALFLFVGPLKAISLTGSYAGPKVMFREREPPAPCGTFTLAQTAELVKAFQPESTFLSRIPNFDPEVEVEIIRIEFSDAMIDESRGQVQYFELLHDGRDKPASIECS